MQKGGLSTIIVTLILILVSLVAVGIVWVVVRNIIQTGTEGVGLSQFSLNAKILDVSIDNSSNNISLTVKRNAGEGELEGISFVFSSEGNTEVITRNVPLKELEQMKFIFHLDNTSVSDLISVSIVPLIKQEGKQTSGIALDKYTLGNSKNTFPSQTACVPTNCSILGYVCGTWNNGTCAGTFSCGTCSGGQTCNSTGRCVASCIPATCAGLGYECGTGYVNGTCSGTLSCGVFSNGSCQTGFSCNASGRCVASGNLIPLDRKIDWLGKVGVEGGIPVRTTIRNCVTQDGAHSDGTDTSAHIQSCIDNTPLNGVAYLPIGNYTLGSGIRIKSNKTLRGAGVDVTTLLSPDISFAVMIGEEYAANTAINIISGYTKESNQLLLQDASSINIGSYLRVDELNNQTIPVTNVGYGTCTWCGRENGARVRGQFVKVTDKVGNTITISPSMYYTFSSSLLPQVQSAGLPSLTKGISAEFAGIEDLTIKNDWNPSKVRGTDGKQYGAMRNHGSSSDSQPIIGANWEYYWVKIGEDGSSSPLWQSGISYSGNYNTQRIPLNLALTSNCWAKNIKIDRCGTRCVQLYYNNYRFELRDSRIVNCINRWDSDNCYGTLVGSYNSGILIENNIFESLADGPLFAWSASGNVVGYNYMYDIYRTSVYRTWFSAFGGSHHGAHTSYNLWEGNEMESIYFDQYWGSQSHNTVFRNRVLGAYSIDGIANPLISNVYAIGTEQNCNYNNYLGNILGKAGYHDLYEDKYPSAASGKRIYRTGYSSSGSSSGSTNAFDTMLRHMNYDYFTNSVKHCGDAGEPSCQGSSGDTTLPTSLYLSSKPSWFGAVQWPPIGPDVSGYSNDIPAKLRF